MSNDYITGDTPIFDQLAEERRYDLYPPLPMQPLNGDEPVKEEDIRPELRVNFHPMEVENEYGSVSAFVGARIKEFGQKHPEAPFIVMETREELDGTITLLVRGSDTGKISGSVVVGHPILFDQKKIIGDVSEEQKKSLLIAPFFQTEFDSQDIPLVNSDEVQKALVPLWKWADEQEFIIDKDAVNPPRKTDEEVGQMFDEAMVMMGRWAAAREDASRKAVKGLVRLSGGYEGQLFTDAPQSPEKGAQWLPVNDKEKDDEE